MEKERFENWLIRSFFVPFLAIFLILKHANCFLLTKNIFNVFIRLHFIELVEKLKRNEMRKKKERALFLEKKGTRQERVPQNQQRNKEGTRSSKI